jgi:hypothetical protein
VGGIEPPIFGLTGRRLTVWPHRITSVRTVGFEPAVSCSRGTRNARLSHVLNLESAQRESNPHFRLGKAAGFRYIMGAIGESKLSKIKEHREGLEPSSPLYGSGVLAADQRFASVPGPVLVFSGTGGHRTHIFRFKRPAHYHVCHSPESVGAEGVEPSACVL